MTRLRSADHPTKRVIDLLVATPLAIVLTPVILLLAIGSAVSYRAWPLFSQPRLGFNGEPFRFVKVRSLPPSTPSSVSKYRLSSVHNSVWGVWLRRVHLDELPQLWLVVAGRMSLVGPRPEMPELASTFDPLFVSERQRVRPGCTGLWQISYGAAGLIGEAPEYDRHYVHNWTVRLDLWIAWRTIKVTLGGAPIESLFQIPSWTGSTVDIPLELAA